MSEMKMTETSRTVLSNYANGRSGDEGMRRNVYVNAVERCKRAGWLVRTDSAPYIELTDKGREALNQ